ncbi:mitotic checkpoint regulator, MAD2B-interacting-domain-containing protein [Aspergillus taichungensis]|uniref:Mitotic checkpoint regulator, MAD2B-interacting-domain-containing protein n=1 Tax=Aspergillus taichungensis TaxID=482145 RepID=A0A2J5I4Z6_9EURO|nr:mitotic checkpoint regulator, MAD2B-interacting-domain-containing protein [Aspergillus taichungensis]
MALVSYSDSDASDSEPETTPAPKTTPKPTPPAATASAPKSTSTKNPPPSIVDRSNPRKIRVALPEIKPEPTGDADDGPARKKPRTGGGGAFSGFNSLLPAPKKNAAAEKKAPAARKPFSLKTGATPGFDRSADAEMRNDQAFDSLGGGGGDEDIPRAGSLRQDEDKGGGGVGATSQGSGPDADGLNMKKPEEVKLKGNPMMFKPLSVGRAQPKKKKPASPAPPPPASDAVKEPPPSAAAAQPASEQTPPVEAKPAAPPKPKVSLFSLGSSDTSSSATTAPSYQTYGTSYEPLVYSATPNAPAAGPAPATEAQSSAAEASASSSAPQQTLDNIADDLNLSRAQRRHLFGRNADSAKSQVLHFNTDREYIANQEMSHADLAAQQHNPVRAIAPGKHSLQQLVNAASSQKEALEESFAAGKRNKQEAGSKYGWS